MLYIGFDQKIFNKEQRTYYSKRLAYYLRHSGQPDENGWVRLESAISFCGVSVDCIIEIVQMDDKNRFEISNGLIRARNGHSGKIEINPGLVKTIPPETLYHCTTEAALEQIKTTGLIPMSRQYVQLSESQDVAYKAASRHKKYGPVLLKIKAKQAAEQGYQFFVTTNGVWQTKHISPEFIEISD